MAHTTVPTTPTEQNKALVRRFYASLNDGGLAEAFELLTADYVVHLPGQAEPTGLAEYRRTSEGLLAAFPDLEHVVEDQIAEGDRVAVRLTARGTHRADLGGLAATGRRVAVTENTIFRLAGGRIAEQWPQVDALGMMQQLGALPGYGPTATEPPPGSDARRPPTR